MELLGERKEGARGRAKELASSHCVDEAVHRGGEIFIEGWAASSHRVRHLPRLFCL